MKYKLIAIDVDGTLITPDQKVLPDVVDAIEEADRAGLRVCIATGRTHVETMPAWRQLRLSKPYEPMVLIGGALVSEPDTGRTLYHKTVSRDLACEFADALAEEGHSAMAIVDVWRHGFDYFLAEAADVDTVIKKWFGQMNVKYHRVKQLSDVADMPDPLRVNAVVPENQAASLEERLRRRFDGRLHLHSIFAHNYGVTVVEAFSIEANKWTAIRYVAQARRIPPKEIVAVGDDVNDLHMLKNAGLGVAMPKASPAAVAAADYVAVDGLAKFIRRLIADQF